MNNEYPIFNTWFEAVDYANAHGLIPVEMEDGRWTVA